MAARAAEVAAPPRVKEAKAKDQARQPGSVKAIYRGGKALGVDEDGEAFKRVVDALLKTEPKPKSGSS
jgi:hypothetical protein